MKFENESLGEELEAELWHHGSYADFKKLKREQALALPGEKMLLKFLKFGRRKLFLKCLLKDLAVSDEEIEKFCREFKSEACFEELVRAVGALTARNQIQIIERRWMKKWMKIQKKN